MFVNIDDLDRDIAVLIYKNKIYEDDNHQFALERALNEDGKSLNINLDYDIDKASKLTHSLSEEGEIATFSVFTDYDKENYIIAHFKENLENNLELIKKYANNKKIKVGYFVSFQGGDCQII